MGKIIKSSDGGAIEMPDGIDNTPSINGKTTDNLVTGPASSTDNAIARLDGTTGKIIQNSSVTIDDSGNIATGVDILNADGIGKTIGRSVVFNTGVAQSVLTYENTSGYLVTFGPHDNVTSLQGAWLVCINNAGGRTVTSLGTSGTVSCTTTGTAIQLTQSSGTNYNMNYSVIKLW